MSEAEHTPTIRTERLLLMPATEEQLLAELIDHAALSAALHVDVTAEWPPEFYDADAVRYTLEHLRANPEQRDWGFYYITLPERADQRATVIGAGGFKGPPDAKGEVELGYGVVPEFQRRGYATEAVRGMTKFAFRDLRVQAVVGLTIPSLIPSIGVLKKAEFRFEGEGSDPHAPEGEVVLRYVLTRDRFTGA